MVVSMDRWRGKAAIVTGASSGIGAAIAIKLVHEGMKVDEEDYDHLVQTIIPGWLTILLQVVGLARRKDRLEELGKSLEDASGQFFPRECDVTNEEDIVQAFEWTTNHVGPIHVLVNNAGLVRSTTLMDGSAEIWRHMFDVNVLGLCIATREAVRDMKKNNVQGHIVHINSVAGHRVLDVPFFSVYSATKHAVTAVAETLKNELNHTGDKIKVTSVSPGLVRTELIDASEVNPDAAGFDLSVMAILEPEDVADAVIYAVSTPPHVQIPEITIKPVGEKF